MERESSTEKPKRGGRRPGAGRKKTGTCRDAPHRTRPPLDTRHPVHVVLRIARRIRLRQGDTYRTMHRVLQRYLGRDDFRVVHFSIQHNHLHLLVEAADENVLARAMQSFAINAARAINGPTGCGKVFAYRYHATQIRTARHARHALAYVLNNWRRHREDCSDPRAMRATLDPYASGLSFDGWVGSPRFAIPAGYDPLPVSPARTRLLRFDWTRYGLIDPFEKPGPIW